MDEIRHRAKQVTVAAEVPTESGVITFYRYRAIDRCGEGYTFQGRPGGFGESDCKSNRVFTINGHSSGSSDPNRAFSFLYGSVKDPAVEQVIVTVDDNQRLTAQLANGIWYILFPSQAALPDFRRIEGYDSSGHLIDASPKPERRGE
jgi:hypothetical protein